MARRALILVEGHMSNGPLYVKAARRLGLHPITLSANPDRYDYLTPESLEAIRVDTDNLDALIRECSRLRATYDIAGITGFTDLDELAYATVGKLCRHFDLPGPHPASIERCCDKFTQRKLLAEAGVPVPAYCLAANAREVESSAAEIGLPVILKPAAGSGSTGVRLCRNVDELAEHTTYLLGEKHLWQCSPRIMVEEFAQGPFYSADIMGNEVVGIEAADFDGPPYFVFRECIFPAPLTDEEQERIADISLSCLQALGLDWGPTNIEFRWTKRGPVVIEVNPRLPGGANPKLARLAYGVDLIKEHIKLVIGEEWDLRRTQSHVAAARFLNPDRDGLLDWINGDTRAAAIPGVTEVKIYVEPKTPIVRKGDHRDTIGHVIAASNSQAQTETILQHAVDLITWSITPFSTSDEQGQSAVLAHAPAQPAPGEVHESRRRTPIGAWRSVRNSD
ncbi:acetyl-CoA carboxylase biotin carboxylase subunit family protein [Mesorhizobium sp. WSM2239]|uniref:Acetyl-CoA carboxylase biotin carboxylase subunit family protein n=2 Tax=unclassified Mesorhizobium TaxID=325217 RepID=A0AAU8D7D6_9HYPH